MFPSAEHPDPKSDVFESIVLYAAWWSSSLAVSSQIMVALPAPTPKAGVPEWYALLTTPCPPVAITKSHFVLSASDMALFILAFPTPRIWIRSSGAPTCLKPSRISSIVRPPVFTALGWGEKIMAFRALRAYMALPAGVKSGLVAGTTHAITPTGLPYLTIPFSGISSMIPTLFWRNASLSTPLILNFLFSRLTGSPIPLSSMLILTSSLKVWVFATFHAIALIVRSTSSWLHFSNIFCAASALANFSSISSIWSWLSFEYTSSIELILLIIIPPKH